MMSAIIECAETVPYVDEFDADEQVGAEEKIAAYLFEHDDLDVSEENAATMGRQILYLVLRRFRPDLFVDHKSVVAEGLVECTKCRVLFESRLDGCSSSGLQCIECHRWFCDNCYDPDKGDGCHCHGKVGDASL